MNWSARASGGLGVGAGSFVAKDRHGHSGGEQHCRAEGAQGHGEAGGQQQCLEGEAAQAHAGKQGEDVECHGQSAVAGQVGDDAAQGWLGHVVAQRQGHDAGLHRQQRQWTGQQQRADPAESYSGGDDPGTAVAIGQPADDRAEQQAGDAVAEQRQADAELAQVKLLVQIHPEPGVDPGVQQRVDEHVEVGTPSTGLTEQAQVAGGHGAQRGRRRRPRGLGQYTECGD